MPGMILHAFTGGQAYVTAGSVSVRTLTARSPGGRNGWAFGNPIGPSSSPPECRSAGRLSLRTTTGFRRPTRLPRPPRGARAAESCIEGLLQVAHEHFATRVVDPTFSTAER